MFLKKKKIKNFKSLPFCTPSCQFRYTLEKNLETVEIIYVNSLSGVQVKMHEKNK